MPARACRAYRAGDETMSAMVSTLLRCSHRSGGISIGAALVAATVLLTGCAKAVEGTGHASAPESSPPPPPVALSQLLIPVEEFPPDYPAEVLDPAAVEQAIREADGVADGAVVTPPQCAPPPHGPAPEDAVAVRGTDPATSSSLTVTLTRADTDLTARRDQLAGCPSFTTTAGDVTSTVTVELVPEPPVDADAAYSVQQTVSDPSGSAATTLTLVAQVDDVRVTASLHSDDETENAQLNTVFTDAVLKVRRGVVR